MHRLPFVSVRSLYTTTKEHALDVYVEQRGLDNYSIGDKNDYFQRKNAVHVKNGRLR
jgi:hypothetical protein